MNDLSHEARFDRLARHHDARPPLAIGAAMRWSIVRRYLPATLGSVLEIGCGQGAVAWRLARRGGRVTAIEPDEASFARASERLAGIAEVRSVTDDQLEAGRVFDTVCAFEVLEHIEDDAATLARWTDRVRHGGTLVLSVPSDSARLGPSDRMVGHYRRYDKGVIATHLRALGFVEIREIFYGFPVGYPLEMLRNMIARYMLRGRAGRQSLAERTAGSGRLFQPEGALVSRLIDIAGRGCAALQHRFPDRGPGMVIIARRGA